MEQYTLGKFKEQVYGVKADKLKELIQYKKNIILQGAPGVGKTYTARRLAYYILGRVDDSHIEQVQFHQTYSYEDFIAGMYPNKDGGYSYRQGIFLKVCKIAESDTNGEPYFLIIDEINRGNISSILGEMFSLLEKEYRGTEITLRCGIKCMVPKNLYIIGTMNTADRGLVQLDYALRRRFGFYTIGPAFEEMEFKGAMSRYSNRNLSRLLKRIIELNKDICQDELLGDGFQIGHSYFCGIKDMTDEVLRNIVEYDIIPLINEYWYDDMDKKNIEWADRLRDAIV